MGTLETKDGPDSAPRKWLGDLGKSLHLSGPLFSHLSYGEPGWLIQHLGRDLGDLIRRSLHGETVVQRKEMTCPDHAAIFSGQANTRSRSPGLVFLCLVRNSSPYRL